MKFSEKFKKLFGYKSEPDSITVEMQAASGLKDFTSDDEYNQALDFAALQHFASRLAIGYISNSISACEFRIFNKSGELFGDDYYQLNVKPNIYQTASEFKQQITKILITKGEVLIIEHAGQLAVADNYLLLTDNPLKPVFTQVSIFGNFQTNRNYNIDDVIFIRHNDRQIQNFLSGILTQYAGLMGAAADSYKNASGQKGIVDITAQELASDKFSENFEELINKRMSKFFKNPNAVMPMFEGYKYTHIPKPDKRNEPADINNLKDNALSLAGAAFRIPSGILKGDVANIAEVEKLFIKFCLNPWAERIGQGFCRSMVTPARFKQGYNLFLDTARVQLTNLFDMSASIDKIFSNGLQSQNEIRRKFREPVINTPEANAHFVTKNYEEQGGEKSE
ncbi:MAG: phage portal protein [Oscillospiraceae bacterium]|nr:phage portal protein [Oscillospiraceae bacterium]